VFDASAGSSGGRFARFDELLAPACAPPTPVIGPGTPAMILYSGGTTGLPKGVVLPQFALVSAAYRYREVMRATPADRHFSTLPLFHAGGVELGILGPLLSDMRTTLDRRFSASTYWHRVKETGSTVLDLLGTMMTVLVQRPADPIDRSHGARITVGVTGQVPDTVPLEFERRFGLDVVDIYGNTESGGAMLTSNQSSLRAPRLVGHPNGWSTIAILDDNDCELPAGEVGRIAMRPTIPFTFMLGYHDNPARTVEAWRNQWLHTGDLGRLDEAGNLYFVGRQAHWLRRRGENISAHEVEGILAAHPGVAECIVTGVPSELGEEDVKAWVIARGTPPDPVTLARWCIERMAPFKVPRYIEFVADFPRSAAKQEVERAKLRAFGNATAWDREAHMGRLSGQAAIRRPSSS
jgi:crotonobetaine/carnitine-CoA ligase